MNHTDQEIAIAEACGWKHLTRMLYRYQLIVVGDHESSVLIEQGFKVGDIWLAKVPDYLTDLNAMHEAFRSLSLFQQIEWHHHLYKIVKRRCADNLDEESIRMVAVNAEAHERAEAFLRTSNLWTD